MIDDYTTAASTLQGLSRQFLPPIDQFTAKFHLFAIFLLRNRLIARDRKRRAPPCRLGRQRRTRAGQQHAACGHNRDRRPFCPISHKKTPPSVTGVPSMPGRRQQYTVYPTISVRNVSAKRWDSIFAAVLARPSSANRPNTVGPEPLISVPSAPFSAKNALISPT